MACQSLQIIRNTIPTHPFLGHIIVFFPPMSPRLGTSITITNNDSLPSRELTHISPNSKRKTHHLQRVPVPGRGICRVPWEGNPPTQFLKFPNLQSRVKVIAKKRLQGVLMSGRCQGFTIQVPTPEEDPGVPGDFGLGKYIIPNLFQVLNTTNRFVVYNIQVVYTYIYQFNSTLPGLDYPVYTVYGRNEAASY